MSTVQAEALTRAVTSNSLANYSAIYAGFAAKGIAESDILPRDNVFTYNAWLALGRQVRKGEHGVKVVTWIPCSKKQTDGTKAAFMRPKSTTVFHVSQTDRIEAK